HEQRYSVQRTAHPAALPLGVQRTRVVQRAWVERDDRTQPRVVAFDAPYAVARKRFRAALAARDFGAERPQVEVRHDSHVSPPDTDVTSHAPRTSERSVRGFESEPGRGLPRRRQAAETRP